MPTEIKVGMVVTVSYLKWSAGTLADAADEDVGSGKVPLAPKIVRARHDLDWSHVVAHPDPVQKSIGGMIPLKLRFSLIEAC